MKLRDADIPLVKAFIKREVDDFPSYSSLREKCEKHLFNEVLNALEKVKGGAERYELNSLGNTGCVVRTLSLEAFPYKALGETVMINLPPSSPLHGVWAGRVYEEKCDDY